MGFLGHIFSWIMIPVFIVTGFLFGNHQISQPPPTTAAIVIEASTTPTANHPQTVSVSQEQAQPIKTNTGVSQTQVQQQTAAQAQADAQAAQQQAAAKVQADAQAAQQQAAAQAQAQAQQQAAQLAAQQAQALAQQQAATQALAQQQAAAAQAAAQAQAQAQAVALQAQIRYQTQYQTVQAKIQPLKDQFNALQAICPVLTQAGGEEGIKCLLASSQAADVGEYENAIQKDFITPVTDTSIIYENKLDDLQQQIFQIKMNYHKSIADLSSSGGDMSFYNGQSQNLLTAANAKISALNQQIQFTWLNYENGIAP